MPARRAGRRPKAAPPESGRPGRTARSGRGRPAPAPDSRGTCPPGRVTRPGRLIRPGWLTRPGPRLYAEVRGGTSARFGGETERFGRLLHRTVPFPSGAAFEAARASKRCPFKTALRGRSVFDRRQIRSVFDRSVRMRMRNMTARNRPPPHPPTPPSPPRI